MALNSSESVIPTPSKSKTIPSVCIHEPVQLIDFLILQEVNSQEEFEKYFDYSHCKIDFKIWKEPRDRVAYEILTSEVIYVKSLQVLMTVRFTIRLLIFVIMFWSLGFV
jgi:hypothetical protein